MAVLHIAIEHIVATTSMVEKHQLTSIDTLIHLDNFLVGRELRRLHATIPFVTTHKRATILSDNSRRCVHSTTIEIEHTIAVSIHIDSIVHHFSTMRHTWHEVIPWNLRRHTPERSITASQGLLAHRLVTSISISKLFS